MNLYDNIKKYYEEPCEYDDSVDCVKICKSKPYKNLDILLSEDDKKIYADQYHNYLYVRNMALCTCSYNAINKFNIITKNSFQTTYEKAIKMLDEVHNYNVMLAIINHSIKITRSKITNLEEDKSDFE